MLTELEIQGFRCFPSLTAKPLGRVNLLVGKNNSGKTAFLDAVELVAWDWDGEPPIFRSLLRRNEYARKTYEESPGKLLTQFEFFPANLFHGYRLTDEAELYIRSQRSRFRIRYTAARKQGETVDRLGNQMFKEPGPLPARIVAVPELRNRWIIWDLSADDLFRVATASLDDHRDLSKSKVPTLFLPTERADVPLLSRLWDEVQLTDDESLIPAALRFIEPRVEKVGRRGEGENLHFVVRLKGDKEPRRLGSLGDGMRHILALALHLVPAKDGYLLIDEIDTGLHYSVLAQMWRMVIESARRLNIQVFATTHSMDCIQALAEVHQQMKLTPEDLMLHRLVAGMDKTMSYTPDDLVAVAEFQGEVR